MERLSSFNTISGEKSTETLVRRMKDGMPCQKYKEIDYDKVRQLTSNKKLAGLEQLKKVKKIQDASKTNKQQNVLNQERAAWNKEFLRLTTLRKKLQAEIDSNLTSNADDDDLCFSYREFQDAEFKLGQDFQEFKKSTSEPVLELCEDLKYWMMQYKSHDRQIPGAHPQKVLDQVTSVREQQRGILERLYYEQKALEQDLEKLTSCPQIDDLILHRQLPHVETGIPEDAFDLKCPDIELKTSVLEEFILIDCRYQEKLTDIIAHHALVSNSSSLTGGWTQEDHEMFVYIMDQFPHGTKNRRLLYIDVMRKLLPHKNRAEIVAHEDWYIQSQHLYNRQRALVSDWNRDRRELFNKAKVVFQEACDAAVEEKTREERQGRQKQLCQELFNKVTAWRTAKMEAMQIEHELAQREYERVKEQLMEQEEQEKEQRQQQKTKIQHFQQKKAEEEKVRQEVEMRRLEELKKQLAEQAAYDRERVKLREEDYQHKVEDRKQREQEKKAEQEEKDKILEALRKTVRPQVDTDIMRLWSNTEASKAHHQAEKYINIQQSLFDVPSYNSSQLNQDPRFRLEAELRSAGLMHNDYARLAVAQLKPLQPPRRDMESSLFK